MRDRDQLASALLAALENLLDVYDTQIVNWETKSAQYGQRCCLCGLWISEGTPLRSIYNRLRSSEAGFTAWDYAHGDPCPKFDESVAS